MISKLVFGISLLFASTSFAFADTDVNTGDQAAFDSIKGLGPRTSKLIIAERNRGGKFKDWPDFQARVKGVAEKSAMKLSEAGLTVNGLSKSASIVATEPAIETDTKAGTKSFSKVDSR